MRLDLYYLAERQQLNFELGTKANDGTYNNGAWWRGANPSTNIYKTGELVTLPNAMTGIRRVTLCMVGMSFRLTKWLPVVLQPLLPMRSTMVAT